MKRFIYLTFVLLFVLSFVSPAQKYLLDGKVARSGTTTDTTIWTPGIQLEDGTDSLMFQLQLAFATGTNKIRLILHGMAAGNSTVSRDTVTLDPWMAVHLNLFVQSTTADSIRSYQFPWFRIIRSIDSALYHASMPIRYRIGLVLPNGVGTNGRPYKLTQYTWKKAAWLPARNLTNGAGGIDSIARRGTTGDTTICTPGLTVDPYMDSLHLHIELGFAATACRVMIKTVNGNVTSATDTLSLLDQLGNKYLATPVAGDSVYDYIIPWFMIKSALRTAKGASGFMPYNYSVCLFIPSADGTNRRYYRIVQYPFRH